MIHLPPERCNPAAVAHAKCARCGGRDCLRPHGSYTRGVVGIRDGDVHEGTERIRRVRCGNCGVTHALIPMTLIPWRPFEAGLCLTAASRRLGGERVDDVAEALHASATSVRSMVADVRRVLASLGRPIPASAAAAELADASAALARAARDPVGTTLGHERAYSTAPFSRVTLPWWRRRRRGGGAPQHSVGGAMPPGAP